VDRLGGGGKSPCLMLRVERMLCILICLYACPFRTDSVVRVVLIVLLLKGEETCFVLNEASLLILFEECGCEWDGSE
jgi:hypothetical protein